MRAVAKAERRKASNSAKLGAEFHSIAATNVSKDQIGTRVHTHERRIVTGRGSIRTAQADGAGEVRGPGNQPNQQGRPGGSATAAPQLRMPVQEVNVFDNLSKTLAGHASQLPTDEQEKELEIRRALVESLGNFDEDRTELAKNLIEYKQVFKSQRQWTRVVNEIGTAIQVSARTVFRLIEDFERAQKGGESDTMPDFSLIAGDRLSKEERLFIRARLAIRSVLNEVPNNRKQQAIADVLAEEAYQIWGARSPILLEVSPKPSRFTIDGRKRTVSTNEKEEEQ